MEIISRRHFSFPYCSPGCRTASLELSARTKRAALGVTRWGFLSGFPIDGLGQGVPLLCASVSLYVKQRESIFFLTPSAATAGIEKGRGCDHCFSLQALAFLCAGTVRLILGWLCCHWFQIPHLEPFLCSLAEISLQTAKPRAHQLI